MKTEKQLQYEADLKAKGFTLFDEALPENGTDAAMTEMTAANAPHRLICQHVCRWTKTYAMPCHILKTMPDGRLKVQVFGERNWKGREHISRVRYVEAGRVETMPCKQAEPAPC